MKEQALKTIMCLLMLCALGMWDSTVSQASAASLASVEAQTSIQSPAELRLERSQLASAELKEVFQLLQENHLSKPEPEALIQAILNHVSAQVKQRTGLVLAADGAVGDLAALEKVLTGWQQRTGIGWYTFNKWSLEGMINSLDDPHTALLTVDDLFRFQNSIENEAIGFGFRLRLQQGLFTITEVIPSSPAEQAGVLPGDYLLRIDGEKLNAATVQEAYQQLAGDLGSEAILTFYQPATKRLQHLKLKRTFLHLPEVVAKRFSGDVGYVRITTFASDTGYKLHDEIKRMTPPGHGLQGLIIDLRDNGGGYVVAARDVASLFMEDGLLMYTHNRNDVELETWVRNGQQMDFPVVLLVNEETASASEIVAGALQDHQLATLVGTPTYGKGVVQQVIPLSSGNYLKITLEEYVTPQRRVINKLGIQPDYLVEDEIAQLITALKVIGVKQFVLQQQGEELIVNGVSFPITAPVLRHDQTGWSIRAAVAAALDEKRTGGEGFVALTQEEAEKFKAWKEGQSMYLTYTGR